MMLMLGENILWERFRKRPDNMEILDGQQIFVH